MNNLGEFIRPEDMNYSLVVPAYQDAFAEWPWEEVSKCVDKAVPQACPSGFSPLSIGAFCSSCGECPSQPAYEDDELIERFSVIERTKEAIWYIEKQDENSIALAALCWVANAKSLREEKYADQPGMSTWLSKRFRDEPFIYLDEIFRNKQVRPSGNLSNFRYMVDGFTEAFGQETLVFRSLQPALLQKTRNLYGVSAIELPPDSRKRYFATIRSRGTE